MIAVAVLIGAIAAGLAVGWSIGHPAHLHKRRRHTAAATAERTLPPPPAGQQPSPRGSVRSAVGTADRSTTSSTGRRRRPNAAPPAH